ncbi:FAD dependent oxidoreductase [Lentinula aff. detonsa]|uniref:FAD dependent oxidoreductase n=1 Tax=Lentinula aff. detonsa TaxID=2804958 RepID=A0AA38NJF5_9AGAR|nr:FAD dependent oxidoreductase [Lentinula aff. detonsa]
MSQITTAPPTTQTPEELDVVIVGAGYSGIHQLYHYRKKGYSVRVLEAESDLGGAWWWTRYPGARVDSEAPFYQLSIEEVWKDWVWTERFPCRDEVCEYYQHVERTLGIKQNIRFNSRVVSARFSDLHHQWIITTQDGFVIHSRFFVLAIGAASKSYTPPFADIANFKGICIHTASWPKELPVEGKRVAVIGTGASGVQVIQSIGPQVAHLTVFQRTPNYALAMQQRKLDKESQDKSKRLFPVMFRRCRQTPNGFSFDKYPKSLHATTPEERLLFFEDLWTDGGWRFVTNNYMDIFTDQEANDQAYAFWRSKVCERVHDPEMQEKLAPTLPPYPFGSKRPSLEINYYDVFNQQNVDLIDLNKCEISKFTPSGIQTADGVDHVFDIIVLATGFHTFTGPYTALKVHAADGTDILEKWADGVYTNLGMTVHGFPNFFYMYGPQSPGSCNGPTCSEVQSDWIVGCISHALSNGFTRVEATREAEIEYRRLILELNERSLSKSSPEPTNFKGDLAQYGRLCWEVADDSYRGFVFSSQVGSRARL